MKLLIRFFFIFIIILSCSNRNNLPEKKDVQKTVENIKSEELYKAKLLDTVRSALNKFLSKAGEILSDKWKLIFFLIKFFIVVIITAVVLLIVYFITRFTYLKKYKDLNINTLKLEHKDSIFDEKTFNDLIDNNKLSEAIVYLHRCTIFYMIKNNIIFSKNLTNYLIYLRIKNSLLKEAFKKIYIISEKILFDDYIADKYEFEECKNLFYKNFIEVLT